MPPNTSNVSIKYAKCLNRPVTQCQVSRYCNWIYLDGHPLIFNSEKSSERKSVDPWRSRIPSDVRYRVHCSSSFEWVHSRSFLGCGGHLWRRGLHVTVLCAFRALYARDLRRGWRKSLGLAEWGFTPGGVRYTDRLYILYRKLVVQNLNGWVDH